MTRPAWGVEWHFDCYGYGCGAAGHGFDNAAFALQGFFRHRASGARLGAVPSIAGQPGEVLAQLTPGRDPADVEDLVELAPAFPSAGSVECEAECRLCGVTFPRSRAPGHPRFYCSDACRVAAWRRRRDSSPPVPPNRCSCGIIHSPGVFPRAREWVDDRGIVHRAQRPDEPAFLDPPAKSSPGASAQAGRSGNGPALCAANLSTDSRTSVRRDRASGSTEAWHTPNRRRR